MRLAHSDADCRLADEDGLVLRAQAGDRGAFARLVEHYWETIYRWLYHLGRHREAAEDLAQETFLKAFAALKSFHAGTNFRAWLFRIAYNAFLNQRKADVRRRPCVPEGMAAAGPGPAEQLISREAIELLTRAMTELPKKYRAAFLLRVEGGMSFREIAGVLSTTEETARWRVFRARQQLLELLGPDWAGEAR